MRDTTKLRQGYGVSATTNTYPAPNGEKVLLHATFLNGFYFGIQKACMYLVSEYLLEVGWVFYPFSFGREYLKAVEAVPMDPGSGVLVEL